MKKNEAAKERIIFDAVVTEEQVKEVAKLAGKIWNEHYEPILGKEQVDYMIEKFQSEDPIREQITHGGYRYFLLHCFEGSAGYISIRRDKDALFLSKLYIAKEFRKRGYSRQTMGFLEQLCRKEKLHKIWLTVNKHNQSSIHIYESLGFNNTGAQEADIGAGFVMDDYIMEKQIAG